MGVLSNLVIAVTGTLEHDVTKIKKWIEANGGRYSPNVRTGVTHLISGKDAWKQASDAVRAANKLGVFVVNFDWLEDSLHRKRKLAERQYTWENLTQRKRRDRELKKLGPRMSAKQFNDGCEEIKKTVGSGMSKSHRLRVARKPRKSTSVLTADMHVPFVSAAEDLARRREERNARKEKEAAAKGIENSNTTRATSIVPYVAQSITSTTNVSPASASSHDLGTTSSQPASLAPGVQAKKPALKDLYHYYLDTTGFEYKIILTRCNLRANEITRYRLSILESHTKPHVYCTFIEYFPPSVGNTAGSGEACIQALLDFDKTFHEDVAPDLDTDASTNDNKDKTRTQSSCPPLPQQAIQHHPEAQRLRSLLHPPASSPPATHPYKSLLAPLSSPFATAWQIFRTTFHDLTLLTWEERLDTTKTLYKSRAAHFNIEPFVYMRPKPGLPIGQRTQQAGLFQNPPLSREDPALSEGTHSYNAYNLPTLNAPLGPGIIGQALARDEEDRCAAEARARASAADKAHRNAEPGMSGLKPNFKRPLFNGVNGRPTMDAWGRVKKGAGGSALVGGGVVKGRDEVKEWPYETGRL